MQGLDPQKRALLVMPSAERGRVIEQVLGGLGAWDWVRVTEAAEAAALASLKRFDLLVVDAERGRWSASARRAMEALAPKLPVLALSSAPAVEAGAADACLPWDRLSRPNLADAVEEAGRSCQPSLGAAYDLSCGLPTGENFRSQVKQAISLARRQRRSAAALALLGQGLGGSLGAAELSRCVRAARATFRDSDLLGMTGKGEVCAVLPGMQRPEELIALGQRLLEAIRREGDEGRWSVGAALLDMREMDGGAMLASARAGAERSRELGGDCVHFEDPSADAEAAERFRYEVDLRYGLMAGHFLLHWQPQAELEGRVRGAEVLLRWLHPDRGPVPPSDFIPFSEACGFIDPLSAWALEKALEAVPLLDRLHPGLKVSVNLSPRQFHDPGLVEGILSTLSKAGVQGERLCLELTESSALADVPTAARQLARLRDAGIKVALDDFGSGYASVGYLKQLPLDIIKLDRSMVQDMAKRSEDAKIAELVVSIAHQQGLTVIAEGVEDREQIEVLKRIGCDQYQGYLLSRPQPLERFEAWLGERHAGLTPSVAARDLDALKYGH